MKKSNPCIDNTIPMGISYYVSERGQKKIGKRKMKKLLHSSENYDTKLWHIIHTMKAVLLFSCSEFSHAAHVRLTAEKKLSKKKSR